METRHAPKLSFFESIYIWIYVYTSESKFLSGRGPADGASSINMAFLQFCNLEVICRSTIIILDLNISYSKWIDVGIFICLTILNMIVYERKMDSIVERHNALSLKKRMKNKSRMWIYVILSLGTMIGLLIYISCSNSHEQPNNVKTKPERIILKPNTREVGYFQN